jgi:uncharacterized protein YndB with AHSA1/START domain
MSSDRIEKEIVLRAKKSRVWRALTSTEEFGTWLGARLEGSFEPGGRVHGPITIPGYEHVTMDLSLVTVTPETYFSWRWHPYAVEPGVDYSAEPRRSCGCGSTSRSRGSRSTRRPAAAPH